MVNKVTLIGNLGADPEIRSTPGGMSVSTLRIATSSRVKDKEGNWNEATEWHRVVVWGRDAENVHKFCKKGKQLYIEGRLSTKKWQDKDGKDQHTTEVVAESIKFLGGANGEPEATQPPARASNGRDTGRQREDRPSQGAPDDDIPF